MTRYPCSGCGEYRCDGQCFDECDPDAVELWENIKKLSRQYREERKLRASVERELQFTIEQQKGRAA